jgi:hypothetical protein
MSSELSRKDHYERTLEALIADSQQSSRKGECEKDWKVADEFRSTHNLAKGYVICFRRKAFAWTSQLPAAHMFSVGCFAFSSTGQAYETVDDTGNGQADVWSRLP